ncbi:ribosomal protein S5 domain 2-type protein [Hyaloraphidium curvatum]|nr:ribosomal protein S5 domain 2-type protein [Hyaloraphidium curvatum]
MLSERLKSQTLEEAKEKEAEIDKRILSTTDVAERARQEGVREGVGKGSEEGTVNVFSSLEEIYSEARLKPVRERYVRLKAKFAELYGAEPEFYARAPGRVNLIGDNIDSNGYSVLPLALDRGIIIAARKYDKEKADLNNIDPAYTHRAFAILPAGDSYVDFDPKKPDWATRAKSAFRSTCEALKLEHPAGIQILVDGNLPASAGLASSAAFVAAISAVVCRANGRTMTRGELVRVAVAAEEVLGIQSGGADQAAVILPPSKGTVLLVSFAGDMRSEVVVLPAGAAFVVADSKVAVDKMRSAPSRQNVRVLETRLAAAAIENDLNLQCESAKRPTLRMVQDEWLEREEKEFGEGVGKEVDEINELKDLVEERWALLEGDHNWTQLGYSENDAADELGMTVEDMRLRYYSDIPLVIPERLHLYRRAIHVFGEAARVYRFRDTCRKAAIEEELGIKRGDDVLKELGAIMNESHKSMSELYQNSCPEVDELVGICIAEGALGCKMTGAGWGGCVISLVREADVDGFVERVRKAYHDKKFPDKAEDPKWQDEVVFGTGAGVGVGTIEASDVRL